MKWTKPTSWSWETLDGEYYIERTSPHKNIGYQLSTRKENIGIFTSLEAAIAAAEKVAVL